jgi:intein/homing endonuclease
VVFLENYGKDSLYRHGFKFENPLLKPASLENENEIMYPHDARKNHWNYFGALVADVTQYVEKINLATDEKEMKQVEKTEREVHIAKIPIMIGSKYCSTVIKKREKEMECRFDPGGYFIVNGQEKVIMSSEKMVDNKILCFKKGSGDDIVYTCQINSRRYDWSDYIQIFNLKMKKDGQILVNMSQLTDIPLFILIRALGLESDREIFEWITFNLDDERMINLLRESMVTCVDDDKLKIRTQDQAIDFLANRIKRLRKIVQTNEEDIKYQKRIYLNRLLRHDLLPHLGESILKKAKFIGLMCNKMLNVVLKRDPPDDRDSIDNKRVETPGVLLGQLFKQNFKKALNEVSKAIKKKINSDDNPPNVISQIKPNIIEQGLKTGLSTGIWGITKSKKGVAQSLQRLSWLQSVSYLRRVMAPSMDSSTSAVTSIRQINNLQYGFLCVTGDTEVLQADGVSTKLIKDMTNADTVTTVNKEYKTEASEIYRWFSKMPDKLYEIITMSGRKLKLTPEHPIMIERNGVNQMIECKDLVIGDLCLIKHTQKHLSIEREMNVVLKEDDIPEKYRMDLIMLNLVNKPIPQHKLEIVARLVGAANTDGHIGMSKDGYLSSEFYLGEFKDACMLSDDISNLGFTIPSVNRTHRKLIDKVSGRETNYRTWNVIKNGEFACFLSLLGGFVGKKTEMTRCVPDWIMNGNKQIKREFLSGFQGGDGSKIGRHSNVKTSKISLGLTSQICQDNVLNETLKYMDQIKTLFNEFDISVQVIHEKAYDDRYRTSLKFMQDTENIVRYAENIGYRYCQEKTRNSSIVIEFIKCRNYQVESRQNDYNKIIG